MYHINKNIENLERVFYQNTCGEKQITLLVGEAYHYLYPRSLIKYALKNKRVFITRTFSKLFAMAGCRLGYAVGHSDDIKYIQKLCTPHNVNAFSMLFAKKILTTPGILDKLIKEFNERQTNNYACTK